MKITEIIEKYSLSSLLEVKKISFFMDKWDSFSLKDMSYNDRDWLKNNFVSVSLSSYPNLIELDMSGLSFANICVDFFSSESLEIISKMGGKLKLNNSFSGLKKLKEINFGNVLINSLPKDIGKLNKLEKIHLGGTNIKKLPNSFSDLSSLKKLTLFNKLENIENIVFPDSIEDIDFRSNKLKTIPVSLCSLPNLKHLDLGSNPIMEIPLIKNRSLLTFTLTETPVGLLKANINKIKEFYEKCEVSGGRNGSYLEDARSRIYLSATKEFYSNDDFNRLLV
tara:strand:- start:176 stop:1015 length:840 start_codon:yes stop_codon:yes gene_type:complete